VLTLFFDGLLFGVWLLGAVIPTLLVLIILGVTAYRLTREEYIDAFTLMDDFPPELPTAEEAKPAKKPHRFIASTIVRPPEVRKRKDDDDTEES
jgi:hypothetical protein